MTRPCSHSIARISLAILICLGFSWAASADEDNAPDQQVRKFDPKNRSFVPIAPDQIIPGKVYSHFSQRHGRFVWALAREGGSFSSALGPGTTEFPRNFDLVTSNRETEDIIASEVGDWAKQSQSQGRKILVRLQENGLWQVLQISSVRSHFELDTGRRWEWHGNRKVAVRHTNGYGWRYENNRYVPASSWLSSSLLLPRCSIGCNCGVSGSL